MQHSDRRQGDAGAGGAAMLIRNIPRIAAKLPLLLWLRLRIWWLCFLMGAAPAEARRQERIRQLTSGDPAGC